MAQLTCIIQHSASEHHKSVDALRFIQAAVRCGHQIMCVFFYRDAVDHAVASPSDDIQSLVQQWEALSEQLSVPLVVCHTAAERKAIADFNPAFDASGLTALSKAIATSDRTLQF